jgi:hypothetical protein
MIAQKLATLAGPRSSFYKLGGTFRPDSAGIPNGTRVPVL